MNLKQKFQITLFLIICGYNVFSQDLRYDSTFFSTRLVEYDEWLNYSGFSQVIQVDSFNLNPNNIIVYLGSHYNNMEVFAAAWCDLMKKYNSKINKALYHEIYNRLIFYLEVGRDSMIINILGKDTTLFKINMKFNKELIIQENFAPCNTMGESSDKVNINEIKCISNDTTLSKKDSLSKIRKKISKYLLGFYKGKGTWLHDAYIDTIKNRNNELIFEVTAINKLILYDRDYYEYHVINVKLQKEDDEIIIELNLFAKYSAGLVFVPRRSEYRDMEIKYSNYVKKYEIKLMEGIIESLTE